MEVRERIEQALAKVRPALQADGGDVELVEFQPAGGVLRIRLVGACRGCSLSNLTLRYGIEHLVRQAVPEVRVIETVS